MLRRFAWVAVALLWTSATLPAAEPAVVVATGGERVFICGHSFHIFNARYLGPLAKLAHLDRHETVGSQMIGGSSVTQHWNLPDDKNKVKAALNAGQVDVLTLAPNWIVPDPAIEQFVDLGLKKNPELRVVVQMSWTAFDGRARETFTRQAFDRDVQTMDDLRPPQIGFAKLIEKQVDEINAKYPRRIVSISPVGYAVLALREKVINGQVPGITKQSQLYRDPIGHGQPPIMALCTYVNFATIYGRSPVGLAPFDTFEGAVTPDLHKLLQEIAWTTVTDYAPSGVTATEP